MERHQKDALNMRGLKLCLKSSACRVGLFFCLRSIWAHPLGLRNKRLLQRSAIKHVFSEGEGNTNDHFTMAGDQEKKIEMPCGYLLRIHEPSPLKWVCFYALPAVHFEDVGKGRGEVGFLSVISDSYKSFRFWSMSAAEIEPLVYAEKISERNWAMAVWWLLGGVHTYSCHDDASQAAALRAPLWSSLLHAFGE